MKCAAGAVGAARAAVSLAAWAAAVVVAMPAAVSAKPAPDKPEPVPTEQQAKPGQPSQSSPTPGQQPTAPVQPSFGQPSPGQPSPSQPAPSPARGMIPSTGERAPTDLETNRAILRATLSRSPSDTLGNGIYAAARRAFYGGAFDASQTLLAEFIKGNTRNLNLNDALEMRLLIKGYRDFDGKPLLGYARTLSLRAAGQPDSAAAAATSTLAQWPGAKVRWHLRYELAELARDRGDHATAVAHALAVADTTAKSRLAPGALKLAGDESLTLGQGPEQALKIYQELLRRFPTSPLAPGVRSQVLEMRKKLQL